MSDMYECVCGKGICDLATKTPIVQWWNTFSRFQYLGTRLTNIERLIDTQAHTHTHSLKCDTETTRGNHIITRKYKKTEVYVVGEYFIAYTWFNYVYIIHTHTYTSTQYDIIDDMKWIYNNIIRTYFILEKKRIVFGCGCLALWVLQSCIHLGV